MKYPIIFLLPLFLFCESLLSEPIYAQEKSDSGIDIDIQGGAKRTLIPMAIPDTKFSTDKKTAKLVQDILRRDLDLSGLFKILPNDSFFFDPKTEGIEKGTISFQNWFNVGAQGLIKSSVLTKGETTVLDLRLYIVDKKARARLEWKAGTSEKEIRQNIHDFANAVIKYYTGEMGVFGTRIAFVRKVKGRKQVYVMDMDGSNVSRITKNRSINLFPTLGGGGVFYTSYAHDNPDLWVNRGGKAKKISSRRGQNTGASYCGGKIALTLSMGGQNADIYVINATNGKLIKRLTNQASIDTSPSWNASCSKIAFVSGRAGTPQIYTMNSDGSNQKRLTYKGKYNTSPEWSPKGDAIVFSAREKRGKFDIFVSDLEGRIERLTQGQGTNEDPSFSPDGRYVVFTSTRGGKGRRLWMMTADGEVQKLLTKGGGYSSPSWAK